MIFSIVNKEKYLNLVNFPLQGQVYLVSSFSIQNRLFYDHGEENSISLYAHNHKIFLSGFL